MYHDYDMQKIIDHISNAPKKKLIIDTDMYNGVSDQFAAAYAIVADNIDVAALTAAPFSSSPADGMKKSYSELVRLRDFLVSENKESLPCYRGADGYMKNMITPVKSEAAENIVRIVKEADDIVYIAVLGCFTNVASALLLDPSIADKAVIILLASTKAEDKPDQTAKGDNIMQDFNAARVILECGVPVIFNTSLENGYIPLVISNAEIAFFLEKRSGEVGKFLYRNYIGSGSSPLDENGDCRIKERSIFDIATIALLRSPELCYLKVVPARSVNTAGEWITINPDKKMIYADDLARDKLMSDFFNTVGLAKRK